jgi:hypothetical protein
MIIQLYQMIHLHLNQFGTDYRIYLIHQKIVVEGYRHRQTRVALLLDLICNDQLLR